MQIIQKTGMERTQCLESQLRNYVVISCCFLKKPVLDLLPAVVLLPRVAVAAVAAAGSGVPGAVVVRARLVLLPPVLVVVLGEAPDLLRPAQRDVC